MISIKQEGQLLRVVFRYNPEYVQSIKTIPGARYDGAGWLVPVKEVERLLDLFPIYRVEGSGVEAIERLEEAEMAQKRARLREVKPCYDYAFVTPPKPHQIEGFNWLLQKRRALLADEMGTGKTKQVLDAFGALRDFLDGPFLVIVGINGIKYTWVRQEIPKHSRLTGVVIDGSKARRLRLLEEVRAGKYDIAVINAEALRTAEILNVLASIPWEAIAIDECHKAGLKNPLSQTGRAIHRLQAEWMFALTGTPIMNRPEEAYNILRWLGVERRNYWAFLRSLCIYGGYEDKEVVGYRAEAVKELRRKLEGVMLRRRKKEVLDLPPKTVSVEWIELDKDQAALYKRVKEQTLSELDNPALTVANALSKTLRLRQILSCPSIHVPGMEGAKERRLLELLEEITENGQKALVYSNWTEVTRRLLPKLVQYSPAYITGEVPSEKRQAEVERFQNDPNCKVALGTIGAMGTGFTMTAASYVIFIDWDWTPANNVQAEDRAHRQGIQNPVNVIYCAAKGTIDESLLELLEEKQDIFDMLINGRLMGEQAKEVIRRMLKEG